MPLSYTESADHELPRRLFPGRTRLAEPYRIKTLKWHIIGSAMDSQLPQSTPYVCAICHKPCPLEGWVTDAEGQAVHKECYRAAIIEGRGRF